MPVHVKVDGARRCYRKRRLDPEELFHELLCRGVRVVLVASAGSGKSVLTKQLSVIASAEANGLLLPVRVPLGELAAIHRAEGEARMREAARALESVINQAKTDAQELKVLFDNAFRGRTEEIGLANKLLNNLLSELYVDGQQFDELNSVLEELSQLAMKTDGSGPMTEGSEAPRQGTIDGQDTWRSQPAGRLILQLQACLPRLQACAALRNDRAKLLERHELCLDEAGRCIDLLGMWASQKYGSGSQMLLHAPAILAIFDGLDEAGGEVAPIIEWLAQWLEEDTRDRMKRSAILTTRPHVWTLNVRSRLTSIGFRCGTLEPLDLADAKAMCTLMGSDELSLRKDFKTLEDDHELWNTPLMALLLTDLLQARGAHPPDVEACVDSQHATDLVTPLLGSNRGGCQNFVNKITKLKVLRHFLEAMLRVAADKSKFPVDMVRMDLAELAWRKQLRGERVIEASDLGASACLNALYISSQHGRTHLFSVDGQTVEFTHMRLQEMLALEYILIAGHHSALTELVSSTQFEFRQGYVPVRELLMAWLTENESLESELSQWPDESLGTARWLLSCLAVTSGNHAAVLRVCIWPRTSAEAQILLWSTFRYNQLNACREGILGLAPSLDWISLWCEVGRIFWSQSLPLVIAGAWRAYGKAVPLALLSYIVQLLYLRYGLATPRGGLVFCIFPVAAVYGHVELTKETDEHRTQTVDTMNREGQTWSPIDSSVWRIGAFHLLDAEAVNGSIHFLLAKLIGIWKVFVVPLWMVGARAAHGIMSGSESQIRSCVFAGASCVILPIVYTSWVLIACGLSVAIIFCIQKLTVFLVIAFANLWIAIACVILVDKNRAWSVKSDDALSYITGFVVLGIVCTFLTPTGNLWLLGPSLLIGLIGMCCAVGIAMVAAYAWVSLVSCWNEA